MWLKMKDAAISGMVSLSLASLIIIYTAMKFGYDMANGHTNYLCMAFFLIISFFQLATFYYFLKLWIWERVPRE